MPFDASDQNISFTVFLNYFYLYYLVLGWGIAIDISLIIGRYYRAWVPYVKQHKIICFFLNVSFVILILILMITNRDIVAAISKPESSNFSSELTSLCIIVPIKIAIIVFSFCHGGKLSKTIKRTDQQEQIKFHKLIHQISGILTFAAAKLNIYFSFRLNAILRGENVATTSTAIIILILAFLLMYIITEIGYRQDWNIFLQKKEKRNLISIGDPSKFVQDLNRIQSHDKVCSMYPKKIWMMLNNSVYDFTNYFHPGGQFLMKAVIGKEVGRYFYGSYSLETSSMVPYNHKLFSTATLQNFYIGELQFGETNIAYDQSERKPKVSSEKETWIISGSENLAPNIDIFYLKNELFEFQNNNSGLKWLGRHFLIFSQKKCPHQREYTTLMSFSKENLKFRAYLIDDLKRNDNQIDLEQVFTNQYQFQQFADELPVVIKIYQNINKFSQFISESKNDFYRCIGPFGFGLELDEEILSGTYVFFAGGTGVLPFLDFFQLYAQALLSKLIEKIGGNKMVRFEGYCKNKLNFNEKNFKIILMASFKNKSEFIGKDIILLIKLLEKQLQINYLDSVIRLSQKNSNDTNNIILSNSENEDELLQYSIQEQFDQFLILKQLRPDRDLIKKIYLCGSHEMNQSIHGILSGQPEYINKVIIY